MNPLVRTARTTGLLYLAVALTGMAGFLLIRPILFDPDDPAGTLAAVLDHEALARTGIALELAIVVSQALAALWFYRLFRSVDSFAAGSIAAFGMVNAVVILSSAAMLGTALDVADDAAFAPGGDQGAAVALLYDASGNFWTVGGLFFGLWLIPMGWLVVRSGWMPAALGWVLMVGGVGYVLGTFLAYLAPGLVADLAALPATVGELWMIGYLLVRGVSTSQAPGERSA